MTEPSNRTIISLPSDREIMLVREFAAPRDLVFAMWSSPEHLRRWYVCDVLTMPSCAIDFREGGTWRWTLHNVETGIDYALSGEYREIASPDRLVFTERLDSMPGSEHLVSLTFVERAGVTTLTQLRLYGSVQARDGHLASGMASGIEATFARLDAALAT